MNAFRPSLHASLIAALVGLGLFAGPVAQHVVAEAWSPKGERYESPVRYFTVR